MRRHVKTAFLLLVISNSASHAESDAELEGITIRGNHELPKILYITPWKPLDPNRRPQRLMLHSLYGDVFDPLDPLSSQSHVNAETHPRESAGPSP